MSKYIKVTEGENKPFVTMLQNKPFYQNRRAKIEEPTREEIEAHFPEEKKEVEKVIPALDGIASELKKEKSLREEIEAELNDEIASHTQTKAKLSDEISSHKDTKAKLETAKAKVKELKNKFKVEETDETN